MTPAPARPVRLRPDLFVAPFPGEGVVVLTETEPRVLAGAVFAEVAPLLHGRMTEDEIVDALPGVDPAHVHFALHSLHLGGYLDLPDDFPEALPEALQAALGPAIASLPAPVRPTISGRLPHDEVLEALAALGVPLVREGGLHLVLMHDYLDPEVAGLNAAALTSGEPWFLAKPTGRVPWAGPWMRPGAGPCWRCLARRILRNRPVHAWVAARLAMDTLPAAPPAWSPPSLRAGLAHALVRLVGSPDEGGEATVWTLDPGSTGTPHPVVRRPQCPACGDPGITSRSLDEPLRLRSAQKVFTADGGHRTLPPEASAARFQSLVSPVSGVVDRIAASPLPGWEAGAGAAAEPRPVGIHLFVAGGNQAAPASDLLQFRQGLRTWSGGKGVSAAQARASALGEAIERYSGVFEGDEPRRRATLTHLGSEGIHPNRWMLFSEAQYRDRDRWNAHPSPYARVPEVFDPDLPLDWTPVWSLTHGARRWLPTAALFYRFPGEGGAMCIADSNGAATGNTVEEAILQGFMELVERDATAIWWYNRIRRPAVDLEVLETPYPRRLRDRYQQHGRDLWVLDLTTELGIPCCAAVSRRTDHPAEEILIGLGAHFDPEIAVTRALTEVNQMLGAHLVSGAKLGQEPAATWLREATVDGEAYLAPADGSASDLAARPRLDTDDLRDDVDAARRLVEARGMEFLVQQQTRPDIGIPVVRVIVPGLRPFRPRFAAGRLYDIPVFLRWAESPLLEEAMNPVPFFL